MEHNKLPWKRRKTNVCLWKKKKYKNVSLEKLKLIFVKLSIKTEKKLKPTFRSLRIAVLLLFKGKSFENHFGLIKIFKWLRAFAQQNGKQFWKKSSNKNIKAVILLLKENFKY